MEKSDEIKNLIKNGLDALNRNMLEKALEYFNQASELDSKNAIVWNYKGIALKKLGRLDEAIKCYNKALNIDPKLLQAILNKARTLKVLKKFDLALFAYEDLLEIDSNHPVALDESMRVKGLLSRRAQVNLKGKNIEEFEIEERKIFTEKKEELKQILEEIYRNVDDSLEKINEMYINNREEAIKNGKKITEALISFDREINDKVWNVSDEFITLDFKEESNEIIDQWQNFKEIKLKELKRFT